jgi:hypothetical protein
LSDWHAQGFFAQTLVDSIREQWMMLMVASYALRNCRDLQRTEAKEPPNLSECTTLAGIEQTRILGVPFQTLKRLNKLLEYL